MLQFKVTPLKQKKSVLTPVDTPSFLCPAHLSDWALKKGKVLPVRMAGKVSVTS